MKPILVVVAVIAGCSSESDRERQVAERERAVAEREAEVAQRESGDSVRRRTREEEMFGDSKVKLTDIKVKKFANEAFPQWSMANPSRACPTGLVELTKYMNDQSPEAENDAWGQPLKMFCGQAMPPGVTGFAVSSFGENGKDDNGASDDLASWK